MSKEEKKKKLVDILEEMIKTYENLPQSAMISPVTNYDLVSILILMKAFFNLEE